MVTQNAEPNLFELHGHETHITYSTTSTAGKPQLVYRNNEQNYSFSGDEIRTQDSELGTLVSVSLVRTIDQGSTSLTLVVPSVNLAGSSNSTSRRWPLSQSISSASSRCKRGPES